MNNSAIGYINSRGWGGGRSKRRRPGVWLGREEEWADLGFSDRGEADGEGRRDESSRKSDREEARGSKNRVLKDSCSCNSEYILKVVFMNFIYSNLT